MVRNARAVLILLVPLTASLGGCSGAGYGLSHFDPTEWTNFLDTKKPLPGTRKELFPEGVPGVSRGVPEELIAGHQQQAAPDGSVPAEEVATAPAEPSKPVVAAAKPKPKAKPRPRQVAAPTRSAPQAQPVAAAPQATSAPAQQSSSAQNVQWPEPPPMRAQPAQAQSQQNVREQVEWPAPPPVGTFSR